MPDQLPMAFKGGTSLSKVFRIIQRFSEDIDITIDYQAFNCGNPFEEHLSQSQLRKMTESIRPMVTEHIKNKIMPYYDKVINESFKKNLPIIKLDNDGETLFLHYHSVIKGKSGYVQDSVKLEFGGRNLTIPSNTHTIITDIGEYVENVEFPTAQVTVLSPQKTFWEKITLIHKECNAPTQRMNANRIARHWYDIAKLSSNDIGKQSIKNNDLLKEVVKLKQAFYYTAYAKYDDCINGRCCLLPNDSYLKLLHEDFEKMQNAKMFYGESPTFESVMEQVVKLEKEINQRAL